MLTERRRIRDRVEVEEVALVVELKVDHPVDQLADRRLGPRRDLGVQVQQRSARIADDPAGVVCTHDHLQRRGDRLLCHRENDSTILGLGRLLQDRYRFMHLPTVLVGGAPARQVRTRANQRQHLVGKIAHVRQRFHVEPSVCGRVYRVASVAEAIEQVAGCDNFDAGAWDRV